MNLINITCAHVCIHSERTPRLGSKHRGEHDTQKCQLFAQHVCTRAMCFPFALKFVCMQPYRKCYGSANRPTWLWKKKEVKVAEFEGRAALIRARGGRPRGRRRCLSRTIIAISSCVVGTGSCVWSAENCRHRASWAVVNSTVIEGRGEGGGHLLCNQSGLLAWGV